MEKSRLRKSNSSAFTDNRSASCRLGEGNRQVQKQVNFPKLASSSSAQNRDTISVNWVICESGWRSSNRATGTPIKKLLAEEMFKETEPSKRTPGVIARLMGFDGLPSQQLSRKQQNISVENHQQWVTLTDRSQRSSTSCSRRSSIRSSREDQEFKDVFEVLDSSKMESICYSMKGSEKSKLTEAEITYVKQKLFDVTRLSTDEKLHDSVEFHETIDDLRSNQDLLLKYLEEPDSLFTKHVHDLHVDPLPSYCNRISGMKLLSAPECEGSGLPGMNEGEILWKHKKNINKSLDHSKNKHSAKNAHSKSLKTQVEGKVESSVCRTRIVVLKPNFGKVLNATKSVSSPQSSHDILSDCEEHNELSRITDWEVELCTKKRDFNDAAIPRHKLRESREIAKEITRQMRNNLERSHTKASGLKGYAGDESSSNKSDNESDVSSLVSRNSIHGSNRCRPSSSHSAESSVSREARKRLSERWKITHRSMDMGAVGRSSTLGEMLAMPDSKGRPANADGMVCEKGFADKFVGMYKPIGCVEPMGISSRDGWKDGCIKNLSRSRSVPASCTAFGSPRGMPREILRNEKYLLPKDITQMERIKLVKGNFDHREASSSVNSRSRTKKSHVSVYSYSDCSDTSPEIQFSRKKVQNSMTEDDRIEKAGVTDTRLVPQDVVDLEIENTMSSKPDTDAESLAYATAQDNSSTVSQESSFAPLDKGSAPKHSVAELESPGSTKEAEQPSPVSVLETPLPHDYCSSSSECFENLSSDIHGLWMQIQQLKLGSESYEDGITVISADEIHETREEKRKPEETKEFHYVKHVLTESGINLVNQDSFIASLHASEHPVNPIVFEQLENHWSSDSWPRWERKLLFDRMNSALVVMKQRFGKTHPWVNFAENGGSVNRWIKNGVEENIWKLLEIQQKNVKNDDEDVTSSKWVDLGGEIDVVGREIEKLVMDELVNEIMVG